MIASKNTLGTFAVLCIPGDQALSLFCHTMSMKQVPNLTTFIRDFMLDVGNTPAVVDEVIEGFDSLSEAHEAVTKAQKKIELLRPVDAEATKFQEYLQTVNQRAKLLTAVRPYYASLNIDLIEKRIVVLEGENARANDKLSGLLAESAKLKEKSEEIRNSIVDAGVGVSLQLNLSWSGWPFQNSRKRRHTQNFLKPAFPLA